MRKRRRISLAICLFSIIPLFSCYFVQTCNTAIAVGTSLSAEPSSFTMPLGTSAQSLINVSAKGNPAPLLVNLSASSITGVSTNFNPQQVIIQPSSGEWNSNQSTLTITVSHAANPGVYTLTVYADFGVIIQNVNITLTIESGGYENVAVGGHVVDSNMLEITTGIIMLVVAVLITVSIIKYGKKHCI